MSLIAVLFNNNSGSGSTVPIIIGDVLVSSNIRRPNVSLPTFSSGTKEYFPAHTPLLPSGMIQKLYVIKDNLAIALAGDVAEMKSFLIAAKDYFRHIDASEKTIYSFMHEAVQPLKITNCIFCLALMEMTEEQRQEMAFTGHAFVRSRIFDGSVGRGKWITKQTSKFGMVKAAASGSEDFLQFTEQYDKETLRTEWSEKDNEGNHNVEAIFDALSFIGQLISIEITSLETILKFWGVNYEIIAFEAGVFRKLDNTTHLLLLLNIDLDTKEVNWEPIFCFHSQYYGEVLSVTALEFRKKQINSYEILPLDLPRALVNENDLPLNFELHTNAVCLTFHVQFSDKTGYLSYVYIQSNPPYEDGEPLITLDVNTDGSFRFNIIKRYLDKIVEGIMNGAKKKFTTF